MYAVLAIIAYPTLAAIIIITFLSILDKMVGGKTATQKMEECMVGIASAMQEQKSASKGTPLFVSNYSGSPDAFATNNIPVVAAAIEPTVVKEESLW